MNAGRLGAWQKAVNHGSIGWDAQKEWLAAAGERTCPICNALHGQRAGLTDAWPFGGLTPPAHPSCRCTIIIADVGTTYEQPDLNEALAPPEWKPEMTVEEAEAYTKGTVTPGAFYHGTPTRENAEQIARLGFDDLKISGNTGNYGMMGKGHYFTANHDLARSYAAGTKGPLMPSQMEGHIIETRVLARNVMDRDTFMEFIREHNLHFDDEGCARMAELAQAQGYDAIRWMPRDGTISTMNDELVVFDKKQIVTVAARLAA
jgi:hypothetical protein